MRRTNKSEVEVLNCSESLGADEMVVMKNKMNRMINRNHKQVVLDMGHTSSVDLAGLSMLIERLRTIRSENIGSTKAIYDWDVDVTNSSAYYFFDGEKLIGKLDHNNYIRYECKAGDHLFWCQGKKADFIEATLIAGKIYCIDAVVKKWDKSLELLPDFKGSLDLKPVHPDNQYRTDRILDFISSRPPNQGRRW